MVTPTKSAAGTTPEVAPDPIFQLATGFMSAKHLFIANEIGLFEKLSDGPTALDELARRMDLPRRTTRIVADAMTSLGLLQRNGDQYQNGPLAARYLSRQPAFDLRPFLRFWNRISYQRWTTFEGAVRQGSHGYHVRRDRLVQVSPAVHRQTNGCTRLPGNTHRPGWQTWLRGAGASGPGARFRRLRVFRVIRLAPNPSQEGPARVVIQVRVMSVAQRSLHRSVIRGCWGRVASPAAAGWWSHAVGAFADRRWSRRPAAAATSQVASLVDQPR